MIATAERKDTRIKVNDEWQGYIEDGAHAIGYILSLGMEDLKYMSKEGMVDWIEGALELATEMLSWKKDNGLKRRILMYQKSLQYVKTREQAMNLYVNIAMGCEGMSTLSGFGMASVESRKGRPKVRSKIRVNPERSTYKS